jgi:uncharacterized membrane protein YgaE (UPF0421/DUF939 family)
VENNLIENRFAADIDCTEVEKKLAETTKVANQLEQTKAGSDAKTTKQRKNLNQSADEIRANRDAQLIANQKEFQKLVETARAQRQQKDEKARLDAQTALEKISAQRQKLDEADLQTEKLKTQLTKLHDELGEMEIIFDGVLSAAVRGTENKKLRGAIIAGDEKMISKFAKKL